MSSDSLFYRFIGKLSIKKQSNHTVLNLCLLLEQSCSKQAIVSWHFETASVWVYLQNHPWKQAAQPDDGACSMYFSIVSYKIYSSNPTQLIYPSSFRPLVDLAFFFCKDISSSSTALLQI